MCSVMPCHVTCWHSLASTEIPVLWINVDPEGQWLKKAELEQSDNTWQYVLRYERSATMQIKVSLPSRQTG